MSIFKDKVVKLLDEKTSPYLKGRIEINTVMNSSSIKQKDEFLIVVHVKWADRKSSIRKFYI